MDTFTYIYTHTFTYIYIYIYACNACTHKHNPGFEQYIHSSRGIFLNNWVPFAVFFSIT